LANINGTAIRFQVMGGLMDKNLSKIVQKLSAASGANLQSMALYGSAASGEFLPKHSDLNLLCLLRCIDPAELRKLKASVRWWARKGHPAPLLFTLEELVRAADLYAIELLEIKSHRRMLYGPDVFESIEVPMTLHRHQVERELRHSLIRIRQGYVPAAGDDKALRKLMLRSVSTFSLLFTHALIVLGEQAPSTKLEAVKRLAALLGFDDSSFVTLLAIRRGENPGKGLDLERLFNSYLSSITQVVDEIDRRFDQLSH